MMQSAQIQCCVTTYALSNLEGWDGFGSGREVQEEGDIDKPMADSS